MFEHLPRLPGVALAFVGIAALSSGCGDAPPPLYGDVTSPAGGSDGGSPMMGDCSKPCGCPDRTPPSFANEMMGVQAMGSDMTQSDALIRANHWRTAAGLTAINGNALLQKAAMAHADYMKTATGACDGGHYEKMGCTGYTGTSPFDRMTAAGYKYGNAAEVMYPSMDAKTAVDGWIWTVYHRIPFVDYHYLEVGAGYGGPQFVMDFGTPIGMSGKAPSAPTVFPLPGQTGVPTSFDGSHEGPMPPAPDTGIWPSGIPITIYFNTSSWTITDHHLFNNAGGGCTDVPHAYITPKTDMTLMGTDAVFMYANTPLMSGTEYVVQITGTNGGKDYSRSWAFTTQ